MSDKTLNFIVSVKAEEAVLQNIKQLFNPSSEESSTLAATLAEIIKQGLTDAVSAEVETHVHSCRIVSPIKPMGGLNADEWIESGHQDLETSTDRNPAQSLD